MPFKAILRELVESTPGAIGAIIADWEGEAVEQYSLTDIYELKVTAAHKGIIISQLKNILVSFPVFGELKHVIIKTVTGKIIVGVVGTDYSLVMTLGSEAQESRAVRQFAKTIHVLMKEVY